MKSNTTVVFSFSDIVDEFLEPAGEDVEALRQELGDHFTWGTNKASLVGLTAFCDAMRNAGFEETTISAVASDMHYRDCIDMES